jgi:hypothetical protein
MLKPTRAVLSLLVLALCNSFGHVVVDALPQPPRRVAVLTNTKPLRRNFPKDAPAVIVTVATLLRGGGSSRIDLDSVRAVDLHLPPQPRGGGADIDKSATWTLSDLTAMDLVYLSIHGVLLAAIVLFCRSATRTGGRAPSWMTSWVGDPYATALLHAVYFGGGALLPSILPRGLSSVMFSPPSVTLLGTVFPAVESVRAAVTDSGADDRTWLSYWVIHGIFQYSTEFMDQLALKYESVYHYWHTFEVLVVLWLVLPLTDGATLIYKTLAQPYLLPLVAPIKNAADGWVAGIALTTINASYLWWFSFIFMQLPVTVKRYAVMGAGSILPVASTVMALASTADNSEMRWLTYWPCFSLLFVTMIGVEKFVGSFKGLYVVCLGATLYLMLPMFDGSMKVFRKVLVPLLGQQELLLVRDAHALAAEFFKQVPADRQAHARQQAAQAFVDTE